MSENFVVKLLKIINLFPYFHFNILTYNISYRKILTKGFLIPLTHNPQILTFERSQTPHNVYTLLKHIYYISIISISLSLCIPPALVLLSRLRREEGEQSGQQRPSLHPPPSSSTDQRSCYSALPSAYNNINQISTTQSGSYTFISQGQPDISSQYLVKV